MSSRVPWDPNAPTPFDQVSWPNTITARVVQPGEDPRIHGYAVSADLAKHYGFSDVVFLTLTGELPTDEQSAKFARALILLSAISVGEAPSHAASLARVCDGSDSAVIGTAAIALSEQARVAVAERQHPAFALLAECGIERADQLQAIWVVARIAVVAAEGFATPSASFRDYPLNVPPVRYEEEK